ncbi:molybdopterin cofactor-binding domain-containing protein [Bradyrhizobium sp. LHD-71]|uniref:xanthine dehydrogenase family protein molybdopterin-binding subunit n=1 Tax=Bradyrhizobium sp. LHD-71 TaxID=3072141 RepID=UPI00280F2931|nr:molybdopterin cofactor-binding domain-containing protein [Bradyrhizobium sp. LHD-71]MDQ8727603.1 molybdopterin-dependent oxidoreductase [Bradyrhizobium sp. LHD-71]
MKQNESGIGGAQLNRRGFLQASGGLVVAFSLFNATEIAVAEPAAGRSVASPPAGKLYAWLAVHPDNTATLFTGKVETGNGVLTALAQIAAEELDLPIDRLDVVMGTTSQTVDQGPSYGSMTVRYAGPQIRQAAAAGRQVLIDLAAKHFGVSSNQLVAREGTITILGSSDRSITYGKLVDGKRLDVDIGASGERFAMKVAPEARTKDPSTYTVVGKSVKRKDIPGKVTGEFTYVQDVKVDGMLHGRVVRPYGVESRLLSVDENGLKDIPGFVQVVRRENFLGVVAETEWGAIQAAEKLGSTLNPSGPDDGQAKWSNWNGLSPMDQIWDTLRQTAGINRSVASTGSVDIALASQSGGQVLKATYKTPFQMHGSIGPSCAIADVKSDRATLWSGTQMPHETRGDIAKILGIPLDDVELRWFEASGGYGRNGLDHSVADAAIMSQEVGRPVRVQWMRWDEHGWEPKGPPIVQDLLGIVDKDGNAIAWRHHMWVPTITDTHLIAPALIGKPDVTGITGTGATPVIRYVYTFDNTDVAVHDEGRVGLLTAWLRSPAQFETTFAMESFIDEMAVAAGQDPLAFRLAHIDDPRAIAVLKAAAEKYGWVSRPAGGKKLQGAGKPVQGRGIAWVNRDDVRVATIADVTVDPASGQIKVGRVVVAHDCGLVVNPDGLRNQVEGNVIQSLSRTLHEEVTFDRAHVTSRDWEGYPILRFSDIPDSIDVVLVNNTPQYPSYGAGEPATNPTAAVISNAVFDAVGVRLRQTPFRPERVKAAMG